MEKELDFTDRAALKLISVTFKHIYDYYKHMTTLSTGSLLIIVALLEGVFKKPEGMFAVAISICCFTVSLVCALVTLGVFIKIEGTSLEMYSDLQEEKKENTKDTTGKHQKTLNSLGKRGKVAEYITMYTFIAGIVMFLTFAFINFFD